MDPLVSYIDSDSTNGMIFSHGPANKQICLLFIDLLFQNTYLRIYTV